MHLHIYLVYCNMQLHTSLFAYWHIRADNRIRANTDRYLCIRHCSHFGTYEQTIAYVQIQQHTNAYVIVRILAHTIRQSHM